MLEIKKKKRVERGETPRSHEFCKAPFLWVLPRLPVTQPATPAAPQSLHSSQTLLHLKSCMRAPYRKCGKGGLQRRMMNTGTFVLQITNCFSLLSSTQLVGLHFVTYIHLVDTLWHILFFSDIQPLLCNHIIKIT